MSSEDYSTDSSESSSETIRGITTDQDHLVNAVQSSNQLIFCEVEVNKKPVKLQIDCGSTVCILPKRYIGNAHICPDNGESPDVEQNLFASPW